MKATVCGIVLGAGSSRRLGRPKQTLPLGDTTLMLLLGDMPGVDAGVIGAVRADWEQHRPWAAVTDYRGEPGHPFVFSADAFPTLRGLHGDKAVWKILDAQPERVRRIPVDRPLPRDVDTWDDYETVCAAFGFTAPAR